jgi:hypothetical protein
MLRHEIIQLKAQIEYEERLYRTELKTTQRIENLKAISLRISTLKQQLAELDGKPFVGLSTIILTLSLCPN